EDECIRVDFALHDPERSISESHDLKSEIVLVAPEIRNRAYGLVSAKHVPGCQGPLILCIAPGFQPHSAAAIQCQRKGAAVAGGKDIVRAGPQSLVDGDAVFSLDPGRLGQV